MEAAGKADLVIIGGGPGGYETALEAASAYGMKTVLVEEGELGGTCLNRGCIPTKALMRAADLAWTFRKEGPALGLGVPEEWNPDLTVMQSWKEGIVARLRDGVAAQLKRAGVSVISGRGQLKERNQVLVKKAGGEEETLTAEHILLATGSEPSLPPIAGRQHQKVLTSDGLLSLQEIPESLVVIGGGVIGMELAYLYSALGSRITVIEAMDRILPPLDVEISRNLKLMAQKERGIEIHTSSMVQEIAEQGGKLVCRYTEKNQEQQASGDYVLLAVGRRPHTAGLAAADASEEIRAILPEKGPVQVDEGFRTAVPGIYAIGDVIGGIQLAHAAVAEGRAALSAMQGKKADIRLDLIPSCVYTEPEIACVGWTAEEAKAKGFTVKALKLPMGTNGKSVLSGQERGYVKLIADKETDRLLGAQLMCARATDLISELTLAISAGMTLGDLAGIVYPHPTISEAIGMCSRI